jgi:anti-sigma factor RsiW
MSGIARGFRSVRPVAECDRLRPVLLGVLSHPDRTELTAAARDHLEMCGRCRAEIEGMVLAGVAIRRTFAGAASAAPPDDAWPRLRQRLARPAQRVPIFASSLAGLILAVGMATALIVPATLPTATTGPAGADALETRAPGGPPVPSAVRNGRLDFASDLQSPSATVSIGTARQSQARSRAQVELMRYELAPHYSVHTPPLRTLNATVQ